VIKAESDYYPWGGELQFVNNDSNHYRFTGKERDTETGLDYFGARYYSNGLGRWVSADWSPAPIPVPYADLGDPQSLNLYGYVRNTPVSRMDRDGHCVEDACIVEGAIAWTIIKWVGTGVIIGGGAAITYYRHRHSSPPPPAAATTPHSTPNVPPPPPPPAPLKNPDKKQQRLPQDKKVNSKAPAANDGKGTVGPNPNQNVQAQADVQTAKAEGGTDIRMNQQQVNAEGERVGINRPDLQYTDSQGVRQNIEYETSPNGRGDAHAARTQANDPNAKTETKVVK